MNKKIIDKTKKEIRSTMITDKYYTVISEIKTHTKPLVVRRVITTGRYKKQTENFYCFEGFSVRKDNVIVIALSYEV